MPCQCTGCRLVECVDDGDAHRLATLEDERGPDMQPRIRGRLRHRPMQREGVERLRRRIHRCSDGSGDACLAQQSRSAAAAARARSWTSPPHGNTHDETVHLGQRMIHHAVASWSDWHVGRRSQHAERAIGAEVVGQVTMEEPIAGTLGNPAHRHRRARRFTFLGIRLAAVASARVRWYRSHRHRARRRDSRIRADASDGCRHSR